MNRERTRPSPYLKELLATPIKISPNNPEDAILARALELCGFNNDHSPSLSELIRFLQLLDTRKKNYRPDKIIVQWRDPASWSDPNSEENKPENLCRFIQPSKPWKEI